MKPWERALGLARRVGARLPGRRRLVCSQCGAELRRSPLYRSLRVCDNCGNHFPLSARRRIETIVDPHSFVELEKKLSTRSPQRDYARRVKSAERETHLREAVVIGTGHVQGVELMLVVLDFRFLGGSMGAVVGEKITRAFEIAAERRLPLLAVTASGGARIQEGMIALMQMVKTVAAVQGYQKAGCPFITLLAHPTTGGVYASFANLADVILAEPRALIGFSGPRVIEVLTRQKLPSDSHHSEFLLEHGMIDAIVTRQELKGVLAALLNTVPARDHRLSQAFQAAASESSPDHIPEASHCADISPWQSVLLARRPDRPTALDYIERVFDGFIEFHGDRLYGDDPAVVAGLARLGSEGMVVIGQERGRAMERERRRQGRAGPEGYRKAQRFMHLAARWHLPLITFVDTPGAASDYDAEKRGIAFTLSRCIAEMLQLPIPTVALVIGEGGSGGALALAAADMVLMLEHAVFAVISPEGASAILYGDAEHAVELSGDLRLTARDLRDLKLVDEIIPEPPGGAHTDVSSAAANVRTGLLRTLAKLQTRSMEELLPRRRYKYRAIGNSKPAPNG